ncbi:hypothetical protein DSO57_1027030 [Entomophthora muscae]|uniref:Uncharacterized protein n=1 Tax=Entomophthora muscae TaxID=34485 RepID=A0ACC2TCU7_9FUNG|nr:hypothetical protein DSO57_1027030 [Entomophthora muscae]
MYPTRYTKPAEHPFCGPVSALGGNNSLPDFYFEKMWKPSCLIQGYSYDYLKRVVKRKLFYPQDQAKSRPKKIFETFAQLKDCHLESLTLANINLETPTSTDKPFSEKLYPIEAGDCFKDEKVSEDDEASQEEKVIELLISQFEYRSLAENIAVSLLSLLKSLPPEEPGFSMQPLNKSCSSKGFEDKCLPKGYHLESFGSLALTEVNPGQSSSPGITDEYIQPGHFPCEDHQSCAKFDLTRAKVCSNDVKNFKDDEQNEETEKDLQEAESVVFPITQVEEESLVEKIVVPPFPLPEPLPPKDPGTDKPFPYPCHGPVKNQGGNV